MDKFCSIIITHWAQTEERSEIFKKSLNSLIENTKYPHELIVVDNGGSFEDTEHLLKMTHAGEITVHIRNSSNMSFGYARNQGLQMAQGDYICIADNDIEYREGWLTKCIEALEMHPEGKYYATPLDYPTPLEVKRYTVGDLGDYKLNMRAGSNCFVIRRSDMEKIGKFPIHRVAGTKWTDRAVRMGYLALVLPGEYVYDMGLRRGYNMNHTAGICIKLSNGEGVYFNQDEYKKDNDRLHYSQQKSFNS